MSPSKRKFLIFLGWTVSAVFLYFMFKRINMNLLWEALKTANYWWIIPNILLIMGGMVYRAFRWQIMLDPIKHIGLHDLFASTMVGFMASNILPLRMGEFVRAYSIGKIGDLSRSAAFATIVLERIFDVFTLLLMLAVIMIFRLVPMKPGGDFYDLIVYGGYIMLGVSIGLFLLLVFLKVKSETTLRVMAKILKIFPSKLSGFILNIFEKFAHGLTVLGDFKSMLRISIHSILLWIITALSNYFIFMAFGLSDLPLTASFVVLIVVTLGIVLPNAPGYVGVYHALVYIALSIYPAEVSKADAGGVAIIMHGAQYIVITAVGLYYLYAKHLSLHEARAEAEEIV